MAEYFTAEFMAAAWLGDMPRATNTRWTSEAVSLKEVLLTSGLSGDNTECTKFAKRALESTHVLSVGRGKTNCSPLSSAPPPPADAPPSVRRTRARTRAPARSLERARRGPVSRALCCAPLTSFPDDESAVAARVRSFTSLLRPSVSRAKRNAAGVRKDRGRLRPLLGCFPPEESAARRTRARGVDTQLDGRWHVMGKGGKEDTALAGSALELLGAATRHYYDNP